MPPTPRDVTIAPPQRGPSLHPYFGPWLGAGLVPWVDSVESAAAQASADAAAALVATAGLGAVPFALAGAVGQGFAGSAVPWSVSLGPNVQASSAGLGGPAALWHVEIPLWTRQGVNGGVALSSMRCVYQVLGGVLDTLIVDYACQWRQPNGDPAAAALGQVTLNAVPIGPPTAVDVPCVIPGDLPVGSVVVATLFGQAVDPAAYLLCHSHLVLGVLRVAP